MFKQYTNSEIVDIIEEHGLGYTIKDYLSGDSIKDPLLAQKWTEAKELFYEIEQILFPEGFEPFEDPKEIEDDDGDVYYEDFDDDDDE